MENPYQFLIKHTIRYRCSTCILVVKSFRNTMNTGLLLNLVWRHNPKIDTSSKQIEKSLVNITANKYSVQTSADVYG